ncbi:MAG TPA: MurT ligase domain-containing protein [Candidatus Limnocylindria bacterium]
MTFRTAAAVAAGKLTRAGLRTLGRGATALPGLVALAVDPGAIGAMTAGLAHGAVLVSGTNGKTTTARMLADVVRAAGWAPIHNRSGSNLDRGIAAALLAEADWSGAPSGDVAIFEVDEASVPRVLGRIEPRVVLVTNLFRDQLDRYFEVDQLARRMASSFAALPETTTLVLNADDPIVARLGDEHRGRTLFFGIDDPTVGGKVPQAISDATHCPRCGTRLRYERVILAHVGDWSCPGCGLSRPRRDVSARAVELRRDGSLLHLGGAVASAVDAVEVPVPGLYNAYNALAAVAAAEALGIGLTTAARAIAAFRPAFGRLEVVEADGRRLRIVLVKNPAGFNAAIGALLEQGGQHRLLAALNDQDADGRDVSWIWDADFEALVPAVEHAVVTGLRARDLALRFKYAGLPRDRMEVADGWAHAVRRAIELTPIGAEVVVVTTYTAMLALRDALARMGFVRQFWED